jgi:hypothetical protein
VIIQIELEGDVHNVVLGVNIVRYAQILGPFEILVYLFEHVGAGFDVITLDPELNLGQALASSHSADEFVSNLQEDLHQSPTERKMVVFKFVPLWSSEKLLSDIGVNDHQVSVHLRSIPVHVHLTFFYEVTLDLGRSFALHILGKLFGVRFVTDAPKELDSLLALHFLKHAEILDKCLLILAHLN